MCVQYFLPDSITFSLQDLTDILSQLSKPFIIVCDFNSRSPQWGSSYINKRDNIVEKFLNDPNLILLNDSSTTRHSTANRNLTAIDLSIASTIIAPHIK